MKAVNLANRRELASNLLMARNIYARMKGLLGKRSLLSGEGLLIKPCKGIHTFGMRFAIDAVFLDRDNLVVAVIGDLRPNRFSCIYLRAVSVMELPAGTVEKTAIAIGDEVGFV